MNEFRNAYIFDLGQVRKLPHIYVKVIEAIKSPCAAVVRVMAALIDIGRHDAITVPSSNACGSAQGAASAEKCINKYA